MDESEGISLGDSALSVNDWNSMRDGMCMIIVIRNEICL